MVKYSANEVNRQKLDLCVAVLSLYTKSKQINSKKSPS